MYLHLSYTKIKKNVFEILENSISYSALDLSGMF